MRAGSWTTTQIDAAGELAVVDALRGGGWDMRLDEDKPSAGGDILASSGERSILLHVTTAISPETPPRLDLLEMAEIGTRAARLGAEPWLARVTLDGELRELSIEWSRLDT